MTNWFTDVDYLEMRLLRARLEVLKLQKKSVPKKQLDDYPDRDFALAEVRSKGTMIQTLHKIEMEFEKK